MPSNETATPTRVRERREARELTQSDLAEAVALSRQSIHAIETGRASPSVAVALRIAQALDSSVEALFGSAKLESKLATEPVGQVAEGRVGLAHIAGRWLSYPLDRTNVLKSADAIARTVKREQVEVELLRSSAELRENVVVMGCAPALGLLADRLNFSTGPGRFIWLSRSNKSSLRALSKEQAHVSGVHLVDAKVSDANVEEVRRHAARRALSVVGLGRWEVGLLTARGNPKRITDISSLAGRGVRLVAREPGSGARQLLELELKRAGLTLELVRNSACIAAGHLEVAQTVALGAADVGIASRDASIAFGLGFVPLAEERYDLVLARDDLRDLRVARLLDVMTASAFRGELSALGYDMKQCGARITDIPAN